MAKRSVGAMVVTLGVAVMVGMRDSTGLAPPPPVLTTEEVVWLAPDVNDAGSDLVEFVDPELTQFDAGPVPETVRGGPLRAAMTHLRTLWGG